MLISGLWHLCDDGITRPVFRGEILAGDGTWVQARFLVDIGADRTVFSADILEAGRDITNLFAVIVDRPGDVVCLVGLGHRYLIQTK